MMVEGYSRKEDRLEIHDQVAAKRFVLVGDNGMPTAFITGAKDGVTGFVVTPATVEGASVTVGISTESGEPSITLLQENGSAVLIALASEGALVQLTAADGTTRTITPKGDYPES